MHHLYMYKIVINATPLCESPTGIGLYTFHLINNLHKLQWHNNFELVVYYQPGMKNWLKGNLKLPTKLQKFSNSYVFNLPVRATNILLNYTPQFFPQFLERKLDNPDIFHGTDFSVFPFRKSKKVMTIHDLTFIKYPHYVDSVVKQYFKRVKKCLNFVDLILTVSESSKQDIVEYLNVNPEKIHVTPLGTYYSHQLSFSSTKKISSNHTYDEYFSKPYILFVSTIEPRKNINNLITAFEYLKKQHKIEHQLILVGKKGWKYKEIFMAMENSPWKNHIHHLSYLSD